MEMTAHPWHDVPLNDQLDDWVPVFIEISRGSKVKYELDKETGLLRVDRVLYSSVYYPANYGFIPRTLCADGDPLDILVLGEEAILPGALLRARIIGVMRMRDENGQDDKLIAVHIDDPMVNEHREVTQLSPARLHELRQFFLDYKTLEGKEVTVGQPLGRVEALEILREAIDGYIEH
jgi:inorganic pyrophosphatase